MLQSCISAILGAALLFAIPWTPPRTAWGDPDLQGTTPTTTSMRRRSSAPREFDGKRASDLTPAEHRGGSAAGASGG